MSVIGSMWSWWLLALVVCCFGWLLAFVFDAKFWLLALVEAVIRLVVVCGVVLLVVSLVWFGLREDDEELRAGEKVPLSGFYPDDVFKGCYGRAGK